MAKAWDSSGPQPQVQDRGEYATICEAERVTRAVLATPGAHLVGAGRKELAEHLSPQYRPLLSDPLPATRLPSGIRRGRRPLIEDTTPETARWDTGAVLSTLAEAAGDDLLHRTSPTCLPATRYCSAAPNWTNPARNIQHREPTVAAQRAAGGKSRCCERVRVVSFRGYSWATIRVAQGEGGGVDLGRVR
ncbi:DUF2267 domain-containing protein [Streptomyces cyanogenus]|uniref:Uncharacterized protein n=1 Tax=Streptomyces cyanogenus TaxID=80860 RepID=A0ABX7TIB2_STRCY|nr:hypothetical protein S1361_01320 [Streptomyces cyanogenus]